MIFTALPCSNPQIRSNIQRMYELLSEDLDAGEVLGDIVDHLGLIARAQHVVSRLQFGQTVLIPRDPD